MSSAKKKTMFGFCSFAGVQAAAAATIEPKPHIFFTVFIVGG
jgi:hypothetical protein